MSGNVDTRAIQRIAREIWEGLPMAQRTALRRAHKQPGGYRLDSTTHLRTVKSLRDKHLVVDGDHDVEPLGVLVRAEGLAVTAEQARRRFGRRKHGQ